MESFLKIFSFEVSKVSSASSLRKKQLTCIFGIIPERFLMWPPGLSVSLIDKDINSSWASFCLPNATAPLVTIIHSRPPFWHSATCSTMDANRPSASPCSSSLVITALPNFTTKRLV